MKDFASACAAGNTILDINGPHMYVTPVFGRLVGLGLVLLFILVYVNAIWSLYRHNARAVSHRLVILVFVLAGLQWYRLWYLVCRTIGGPTAGAAAQDVLAVYAVRSLQLFLWGSCAVAVLALLAVLPKHARRSSTDTQGMIGAIAGLSSVLLLQLYFVCFVFYSSWALEQRSLSDLWNRLRKAEQSAAPLPRAPETGHSEGAR